MCVLSAGPNISESVDRVSLQMDGVQGCSPSAHFCPLAESRAWTSSGSVRSAPAGPARTQEGGGRVLTHSTCCLGWQQKLNSALPPSVEAEGLGVLLTLPHWWDGDYPSLLGLLKLGGEGGREKWSVK